MTGRAAAAGRPAATAASGDAGNDGRGGGGASALAYTGQGVLIIAGGGGGGGANVQNIYTAGGGGYGGLPPGNGANGKGEVYGSGGNGGGESGPTGGEGGHDSGNILVGGGGGGGGGGSHGGQGGGWGSYIPQFGYNSPGGGGGGSSFVGAAALLGTGAAPTGPGFITLYAGSADRYECTGSNDPETLDIPDGVDEYAVIAVAGAGDPGNSKARGGHGAVLSGLINVRGLSQLQYWVGCGGGFADGAGFAHGGHGGHAPSPFAKDGGHGGGATAVATGDGEIVLVAGGGGGSGGDIANCDDPPGPRCGGQGGSGGGTSGSQLPANGADGDGGDGGRGGRADNHHENGQPDMNGDEGVEPGCCDESGGGGGGGGGWPMGGEGGHHDVDAAGGGGGAGGSYINSYWMSEGAIATSGQAATSDDPANGYLLLLPIVIPNVDLTVKKTVTGGADEYAQGPFVINIVCTLDGQTTYDGGISFDPGGETTIQVSQGSTCHLTEVADRRGEHARAAGGRGAPRSRHDGRHDQYLRCHHARGDRRVRSDRGGRSADGHRAAEPGHHPCHGGLHPGRS